MARSPDGLMAQSPDDPAVVTLIPGDGIGPEVTAATLRLLDAAGARIQWEEKRAKPVVGRRKEDSTADPVVESLRRTRVGLKGPLSTPVGGGHRSINVALRLELDLYANFRPVKKLPGVCTPFKDLDLVVVRENTEDLYAGLEHTVVPGVVESLKIITERASSRIGRVAFDHAQRHGRKKVTAIHKANIMKLGDGLFLESARAVAREYRDIPYDERIVDAACMQLVMNPGQFDVLVMPNLYGDIVSDLCAGLVGGLGVVGAANLGADAAVFEAVHGSAPDIAGRNVANPTALLLSAVLMLRHIEEGAAAARIMEALTRVLSAGQIRTRDLRGSATTIEFADAICRML